MSAASPIVDESTDIRELIESLDEPSCEAKVDKHADCGVAADWVLLLSCGDTTYLCTPHAVSIKLRIEGKRLHCGIHDVSNVTARWELLS